MAEAKDLFTVMPLSGTGAAPFSPTSQSAVSMLESIMPADKAQAVPRILIWEIDPSTGKALRPVSSENGAPKSPLSLSLVEPPKFGTSVSSADFRFRERPPVSLEQISIKSQNPRGLISYELIDISFTVHRPDVVFENVDQTERDVWASLIIPGRAHALEYGWSASNGVKNGILNGHGFDDDKGTVVQGRRQIRFTIVNYTFTIQSDNQIKFVVHGIEMGEFNLRQAFLVPQQQDVPKQGRTGPKATVPQKKDVNLYALDLAGLKKLLDKIPGKLVTPANAPKVKKKNGKVVKFGKLLNEIFIPRMKTAFQEMGFDFKGVYVGRFNDQVGKPGKKYGGGADFKGQPISDFTLPLDEIQGIFSGLVTLGETLTVQNFIAPFLKVFEDPTRWDRTGEEDPSDHTIPMVNMRTVFRQQSNKKMEITLYIFDVHREYVRFAKKEKKLPPGSFTREDVRKAVTSRGVPYISLIRANSFVKETNFEVVQDEQMKGIMMRRNLAVDRTALVSQPDLVKKLNNPDTRQLFSAAITGDIKILGNFVFDVFQLVWLDFGVPQWDGPFTIMEREDIIDRGEFVTRLKVFSAGTDPLGTQGRPDPIVVAPTPKPGKRRRKPLAQTKTLTSFGQTVGLNPGDTFSR